jgi:hypothetical protein
MQSKTSRLIHIHRLALAIVTAILVAGMASAGAGNAWAAPVPQERDNDITRGELANFDRFLDSHPNIAQDLKSHPGLVNDPNYLSQHPELQEFLKNHPGVREELKENPRLFLNRERRFERSGGDITRGELRSFEGFLDKHPEIDEQLRKNPKLINDPNYLSQHPELQEYLKNHPRVSEELKEHPKFFMHRERQFERHERGEHHRKRRTNG